MLQDLAQEKNMANKNTVISHLIDHVWAQYDYDGNGFLDETESRDFMSVVLQMNENVLAKSMDRDPVEIDEKEVHVAIEQADDNKDGKITKEEL